MRTAKSTHLNSRYVSSGHKNRRQRPTQRAYRRATLSAIDEKAHAASILPRPWWNQRRIHRFKLKLRLIRIGRENRFRRLQEILVIALGEIWFVVRPARVVAQPRSLGNHAQQLQHVVK